MVGLDLQKQRGNHRHGLLARNDASVVQRVDPAVQSLHLAAGRGPPQLPAAERHMPGQASGVPGELPGRRDSRAVLQDKLAVKSSLLQISRKVLEC